jgi:hypothetical protein
MLDFNVVVRQVMALSLERIIWYDFNGFLHVEIFVEEPFFSCQIAGNERWEVAVPIRHFIGKNRLPYIRLVCTSM